MKFINLLIRLIIIKIKNKIGELIDETRIVSAHQTSKVYSGVCVDSLSKIGRYNVLFPKCTLINSSIGDHTYIQKESMLFMCDVGKYCSIAMKVYVGLPQHELSMVSSHPAFYLRDTPLVKIYSKQNIGIPHARTLLGNDVWIGHGALIMSGITIGNGAVIAAGAVVTVDIPDYAIVGGVPAKLIRYRFDKDTISSLLLTKWWDLDEEWIENHIYLFTDTKKLLNVLAPLRNVKK